MGCIRCRVKGRVQGVFFRDSTRRLAITLGLSGSAVNRTDGSVEVIACGPDDSLDQLKSWLREGPPRAEVASVTCEVAQVQVPSGSFRIG